MPYHEPDPSDPQMLVGVAVPGGADSLREMAHVFAEEFARLGYSARQIVGLFEDPFYAGAHAALRALGKDAIRTIADDAARAWPPIRIIDVHSKAEEADRESGRAGRGGLGASEGRSAAASPPREHCTGAQED
jgi:hypothetical protein